MWELALIVADREVKGRYDRCSLSRQLEMRGDNVHKVLSVGQAGLIGAMLREYGQQGKYLIYYYDLVKTLKFNYLPVLHIIYRVSQKK